MIKILGKEHRIRNNKDLQVMRETAVRAVGKYCIVNAKTSEEIISSKYAIIISRRFHKHAVVRNRARRLIKEAYLLLCPSMINSWLVIIPRKYIQKAKMQDVLQDMKKQLAYLGLYKEEL